jgi:hypothetical protein
MNAPVDPVNKAPKRAVVGARHKPPADNLTGRAGACRIRTTRGTSRSSPRALSVRSGRG